MEEVHRVCSNCKRTEQGKERFKHCGRCAKEKRCVQVNYCSRECQYAHWKEHKKVCGVVNMGELFHLANENQTVFDWMSASLTQNVGKIIETQTKDVIIESLFTLAMIAVERVVQCRPAYSRKIVLKVRCAECEKVTPGKDCQAPFMGGIPNMPPDILGAALFHLCEKCGRKKERRMLNHPTELLEHCRVYVCKKFPNSIHFIRKCSSVKSNAVGCFSTLYPETREFTVPRPFDVLHVHATGLDSFQFVGPQPDDECEPLPKRMQEGK